MKQHSQLLYTAICMILILAVAVSAAACGSDDDSSGGVKTFVINGNSMEPTLIDKQTVEYLPSTGTMPSPGDIIIFSGAGRYRGDLTKRVIAVAGQDLQIDYENQTITVDGKLMDESGYTQGYLKEGDIPVEQLNGIVPEGKLFVLGDNRTISLDSRHDAIGLVDVSNIIGTVIIPEK